MQSYASRCSERWVVNHSSRELSRQEREVLAEGLKYAPAPTKIPVKKIVASIEDGLRKVKTPDARNNIVGISKKAKPPQSNLSPDERRALSRDGTIVILPADKGKATILLDKSK